MGSRIVVMGASWGGLRAVAEVLSALPADFPAPVLVAQHRAPDIAAGMVGALGSRSPLPVHEATDKEPLRGGHVYLAPGGYHLLVERQGIVLSTDEPERFSRPSIDVLFEAAADAFGPDAVGVILTGASDDGANGLARIRRRGGVAVVQDPATAERRFMPDAAIATGSAHQVLPLEEIAGFLVELCGNDH
jgi:two-component system chemotaxis response regulator CheB